MASAKHFLYFAIFLKTFGNQVETELSTHRIFSNNAQFSFQKHVQRQIMNVVKGFLHISNVFRSMFNSFFFFFNIFFCFAFFVKKYFCITNPEITSHFAKCEAIIWTLKMQEKLGVYWWFKLCYIFLNTLFQFTLVSMMGLLLEINLTFLQLAFLLKSHFVTLFSIFFCRNWPIWETLKLSTWGIYRLMKAIYWIGRVRCVQ